MLHLLSVSGKRRINIVHASAQQIVILLFLLFVFVLTGLCIVFLHVIADDSLERAK